MQEQHLAAPAFYLRDVSKPDMSGIIDDIISDWQIQQAAHRKQCDEESQLQQQREPATRVKLHSPDCAQIRHEEAISTHSSSPSKILKTIWNNEYVLDAETENAIELCIYALFATLP